MLYPACLQRRRAHENAALQGEYPVAVNHRFYLSLGRRRQVETVLCHGNLRHSVGEIACETFRVRVILVHLPVRCHPKLPVRQFHHLPDNIVGERCRVCC